MFAVRLGAPPFLAGTRAGWARALIAHGLREDRERAQHRLGRAEETIGRLGAEGRLREVADWRSALAALSFEAG